MRSSAPVPYRAAADRGKDIPVMDGQAAAAAAVIVSAIYEYSIDICDGG